MLPPDALVPAPGVRALAADLRGRGARLLVCDIDLRRFLKTNPTPRYDWLISAYVDALLPAANVALGVRTALSKNTTMHVPDDACLSPQELLCNDLPRVLPRLAQAGVTHVLATRELTAPGLRLYASTQPPRLAPLPLLAYAADQPAPFVQPPDGGRARLLLDAPGRLRLHVDGERAGELLVRERWSPGWQATLDGRHVALVPGRRHLAVPVPPGPHEVHLDYRAPGLGSGVALSLLSLALLLTIAAAERRRPDVDGRAQGRLG
jgi:hypothetical protein